MDRERDAANARRWTDIPPAKRFGRRLTEDAVEQVAQGTLLRFYSEDPWFEPGEHSPSNGEIVRFTGTVSMAFPKVGAHLEVQTLDGHTYPGGGWAFRMFQFVAAPALSAPPAQPVEDWGEVEEAVERLNTHTLPHLEKRRSGSAAARLDEKAIRTVLAALTKAPGHE